MRFERVTGGQRDVCEDWNVNGTGYYYFAIRICKYESLSNFNIPSDSIIFS